MVVRFVQEISLHPPTLLELAARVIRTSNVPFEPHELPKSMHDYLNTAHCCVNPKCKGTFEIRHTIQPTSKSLIFSFNLQVFSLIIALNISNSLISVENIEFHYFNIFAAQSKLKINCFVYSVDNYNKTFDFRCIEGANRNVEPQPSSSSSASGIMMRKVLLG